MTNSTVLPVVVASVGGAASAEIHNTVQTCLNSFGDRTFTLSHTNWVRAEGPGVNTEIHAESFRNRIAEAALRMESPRGGLIVGKSAGGMLAWNTLRLHYSTQFRYWFQRCALILVDPHGAVQGDRAAGPYAGYYNASRGDLWWPPGWSTDQRIFRVYNIFEQHHPSVVRDAFAAMRRNVSLADRLTGADFDDPRVYENVRITDTTVTHMTIEHSSRLHQMIRKAFGFVRTGA